MHLEKLIDENSVYSILEYTANDGKRYKTKFYNLDAILFVGYRVNSILMSNYNLRPKGWKSLLRIEKKKKQTQQRHSMT